MIFAPVFDGHEWPVAGVIAQAKEDGKRAAIVAGKSYFYGRNSIFGKIPFDAPAGCTIDGELCGADFYGFDCVRFFGQDISLEPLWFRLARLDDVLATYPDIKPVLRSTRPAALFEQVVAANGEGVVVKPLNRPYLRGIWERFKREMTMDFYLLNVDLVKQSAEVGELVDGRMISRGRVFGFNLDEACEASRLIGHQVEVLAQQFTKSGKLRFGRFRRFRLDKPALGAAAL